MAQPVAFDVVSRPLGLDAAIASLDVYLQPIVDVATGVPLAFEALARFRAFPGVRAEEIFAEAHLLGRGYQLEAACLRAALARRDTLGTAARLAVNMSPDVLLHPVVRRSWPVDLDGVIIEVTEHRATRIDALQDELQELRSRGAKLAVDDVGTGYAGLLRLATMSPDFVKIDRSVVTGVRKSPPQAAVLEALVTFSHRTGSAVIGEGVESFADIGAMADFDVDYAQGFAIGRPAATATPISPLVVAACQHARFQLLQQRGSRGPGADWLRGVHAVINTVANATGLVELHVATAQAAAELGIDLVGVSILSAEGDLREISSSGAPLDTAQYDVAEYPATATVLATGRMIEVHLTDPGADPAELALMRSHGTASLLMIPLLVGDRPVGVLEFSSREHRRWATQDIAHGRGLAAHLSNALLRIAG